MRLAFPRWLKDAREAWAFDKLVRSGGGGDVSEKPEIAALTPINTADATDEATAIALANATKAKVNAVIAALKA